MVRNSGCVHWWFRQGWVWSPAKLHAIEAGLNWYEVASGVPSTVEEAKG